MAEQTAPTMGQKLTAEFLGTFVLVFGVIGAALFAAPMAGILAVAITLGLTVMAAAYAFGGLSGGHFNPAVTVGLAAAGRFAWSDVVPYVVTQALGAVAGAAVLWTIKGFDGSAFTGVSTGYGELSPAGFDLTAAFLIELVATAVFVLIILGVTGARGAGTLAPIAIGLTLTALALVAIPVSNASFNPARSLGTAVFAGGVAIEQLWLSVLAPVLGALVAAAIQRFVLEPARKA